MQINKNWFLNHFCYYYAKFPHRRAHSNCAVKCVDLDEPGDKRVKHPQRVTDLFEVGIVGLQRNRLQPVAAHPTRVPQHLHLQKTLLTIQRSDKNGELIEAAQ